MPKVKKSAGDATRTTAANLGFEAKLWAAADALRTLTESLNGEGGRHSVAMLIARSSAG